MTTIPALFDTASARDAAQPFLTFYDDATGERTELSYATAGNWIQKTANMLTLGAGLDGDVVSVGLPPHWLTGVIMLGAWRSGCAIRHGDGDASAAFVSETALDGANADEVYAVTLAPLAVGVRDAAARQAVADGVAVDFLAEVRTHGDHFGGAPVPPNTPALVGLPRGEDLDQEALASAARDRAAALGISDGERVLIVGDRLRPIDWLLAPLAARGGVVLCVNSGEVDLERRADKERARLLCV